LSIDTDLELTIRKVADGDTDDFLVLCKLANIDPKSDLAGADLRGTCLRAVDLSHADLRGADFSGADLTLANFSFASLENANFSNATFENTNLENAKLDGAIFDSNALRGEGSRLETIYASDSVEVVSYESPPQQTVFIVNADGAARDSLTRLMDSAGTAAESYISAHEFLSTYDVARPGCLLLDANMPDMSGVEMQRQLNLRGAAIPVIVLVASVDAPSAAEAIEHGTFELLTTPIGDDNLLDCVQRALRRDADNRARQSNAQHFREILASLNSREREVLMLVMKGKLNNAVAADLGVSQRTVQVHRSRVMQKLQARSLADLVRIVSELELKP